VKLNKDTDALSKRYMLPSTPDSRILRFELIKEQYEIDEDFKELFAKCSHHL